MFQTLDLDTFRERTGIGGEDFARLRSQGNAIVSMRDLIEVHSVQAMPKAYLDRLIRGVTLAGDATVRPYERCKISLVRMDPNGVLVGQTFVERKKLQRILEDFGGLWSEFCITRGIAKRTPWIVFGRTESEPHAIAHYLPPIVEQNGGRLLLLDGVHRNFLVRSIGTTIETIVVRDVASAFPCTCGTWDAVLPVDEKPPKPERFHDLVPGLFRDVKSIGIDG